MVVIILQCISVPNQHLSALHLLSLTCQLYLRRLREGREINTLGESYSAFLVVLYDREEYVSVGQHWGKGPTCSDLACEL